MIYTSERSQEISAGLDSQEIYDGLDSQEIYDGLLEGHITKIKVDRTGITLINTIGCKRFYKPSLDERKQIYGAGRIAADSQDRAPRLIGITLDKISRDID